MTLTPPPAEPDPRRDVGPYPDVSAARTQWQATAHGIPAPTTEHLAALSAMVLAEALLLTGVDLTEFENAERDAIARQLDPHTVQVVAGWVLRAWRAGADSTVARP